MEEIRRIYRALDGLLDAAGHGALKQVQAAAGVNESYVRDLRARLRAGNARGYDLGTLLPMLEALGVDHRTFFGHLFNVPSSIGLCQLEAHRLGEPPAVVAKVRDLLLLEEWQPLPELPEPIRELDAHRYRDANEAVASARGDLIKVGAGLLPPAWGVPLLGVYGSALRMTDAYDPALQTLVAALEAVEPKRDLATLGDLLRRLSYVVAGRSADHRRAHALARRATDCYVQLCNRNRVGKTFFDRGLWLYKLGELEEAVRMQLAALNYLDDDKHRHRFGALHGLGIYHRELGDLERAECYADRARELLPHVGSWLEANLSWLDARIAIDRRKLESAEELLRRTIDGVSSISSEAAALATTELVRVLLLQDQPEAAHDTAKTMVSYIIPLEDRSPAAAAAALDLLRCGQAGYGVDLKMVDQVAATLETEQACPGGHAHSGR